MATIPGFDSCTEPCRETFTDAGSCKDSACKDTLDSIACEKSCEYLQRIYTEKPGACPKIKNQSNYARAPSSPRDISLGASKLTPIGLWNQIVQWTPPASDLPIKNYQ
ncbi:hypothetical protein ANCDUO_18203, partial [Ancylostoma duodenale]